MDVYNKYIWTGVTDVHEPFLEMADSLGCSASGEPGNNCRKQWSSCPPESVWQLQQVVTPQSTISTPCLDSWKKKKKTTLFPWLYFTSTQHLEIVGCPSISPLYCKEENSSALEPLKKNCKPISCYTKMHKRFVILVVSWRRALRKHTQCSHYMEQTDWSA